MIDVKRILSSPQLPTLPSVAVRLLELTKNPETEIRDVVDVIKADPAISAKIVKAANSTYFGVRSEVKAIDRAVPLLGTTVSTTLALSFSLTDDAMTRGPLSDHYQQYWRQSVVQAVAAEELGRRVSTAAAPEYFLAGLLQDLGRLALLKTVPRDYQPLLAREDQLDPSLAEVELTALGVNHAQIGAQLMEQWKLPDALVRAVQHHHDPAESLAGLQTDPEFPLYAGIAVSACVGDYFCTPFKGRALEQLRRLTADHLHFQEGELDAYLAKCHQRTEEAAGLFQINAAELGDPADLMVQASEQLAQWTLRQHVASTQRQQEIEREKEQLAIQNRELQKQALHDPLTGIYNRHFFDAALEREVARAHRVAAPVALIFADIDHFKKLNDTYGHQFGDLVLQGAAKAFQSTIRGADVLARYGGEEFVILVSQPTEKGLDKLAERIRQRIASEVFPYGDSEVSVTCSFGTAMSIPGRRETDIGKRLIAAADECLYEAKHKGRNQVCSRSTISELDRQLMHLITNHRFSRWLVAQHLLDVPSVSRALLECPVQTVRIGELAETYGYLSGNQVTAVLKDQEQSGERFGAIAIRLGFLTVDELVHILTLQQESPKQLAMVIIKQGLLAPQTAAQALEQYVTTQIPKPRSSATPELATA